MVDDTGTPALRPVFYSCVPACWWVELTSFPLALNLATRLALAKAVLAEVSGAGPGNVLTWLGLPSCASDIVTRCNGPRRMRVWSRPEPHVESGAKFCGPSELS